MALDAITASIIDYTGVSSLQGDTIADAQKFVVSQIPKNLLGWATSETVSATHGGDASPTGITLPVKTDNIVSVRRGAFVAARVNISLRGFLDSGSLFTPTNTYPKYYIKNDTTVVVKPDPDGSTTAHAEYVDYSKLDDSSDLRNAVIFKGAQHEISLKEGVSLVQEDIELIKSTGDMSMKFYQWALSVIQSYISARNMTTRKQILRDLDKEKRTRAVGS